MSRSSIKAQTRKSILITKKNKKRTAIKLKTLMSENRTITHTLDNLHKREKRTSVVAKIQSGAP